MNPIDEDIKRKEFKSVYLLYGPETYLKLMYKNRLLSAILSDDIKDNINLNVFNGKISDISPLRDIAKTMPFFAERRVVVIEDSNLFNRSDDDFAAFLEEIPETAVFIFLEEKADGRLKPLKTAKKVGAVIETNMPSDDQIKRFILRRLEKDNKKMTNDAWNEFIMRARPQVSDYRDKPKDGMTKINLEYEKLISYTADKEVIEDKDVREVCPEHLESRIFDLTDAMVRCDEKRVMELYHDMLLNRVSPLYILSMINRQFMNLLKIREMYDDRMDIKTIAKTVSLPEFAVRKNVSLSERYKVSDMKSLLRSSLKTERDMKTGNIDQQAGLLLLLAMHSHLK